LGGRIRRIIYEEVRAAVIPKELCKISVAGRDSEKKGV
jgi:hypothetical protein